MHVVVVLRNPTVIRWLQVFTGFCTV